MIRQITHAPTKALTCTQYAHLSEYCPATMADVASTSSVKLTQDLAFQAETFKRLHPRAYLERFLAEGFRPDGREVDDWREVSVNVGMRQSPRFSPIIFSSI